MRPSRRKLLVRNGDESCQLGCKEDRHDDFRLSHLYSQLLRHELSEVTHGCLIDNQRTMFRLFLSNDINRHDCNLANTVSLTLALQGTDIVEIKCKSLLGNCCIASNIISWERLIF